MSAVTNAVFASMCDHLEASAIALFRDHGFAVTPSLSDGASPGAQKSVAAVIGYASAQMRGALVIVAPEHAVEAWRGESASADACDVIGEYSNMLLGRLKAQLLREGLTLMLSTPTAARGTAFVVAPGEGSSSWLALDGGGWRAKVRIDAVFDKDFALATACEEAPAEAGDLLFF